MGWKIKLSYNVINESLKKYDLERYNNALKIKINNEIKILPENEEEEERQIKLAIELSQKEGEKEYKKENENIYEKGLYHFGDNKIDENQNIKNIKKSVLYDYFGQISINEIEEEQYDEEFGICPITQEYMKHPVLCPSGNYYEKSAILDWLKKNDTCPSLCLCSFRSPSTYIHRSLHSWRMHFPTRRCSPCRPSVPFRQCLHS